MESITGYKLNLTQEVFQDIFSHSLCPNMDLDNAIKKLIVSRAIDLNDAYLLVPIKSEDKKYLKFEYGGNYFNLIHFPSVSHHLLLFL